MRRNHKTFSRKSRKHNKETIQCPACKSSLGRFLCRLCIQSCLQFKGIFIQQELIKSEMKYSILIRPRFHWGFADNNLLEEILGVLQRSEFGFKFWRFWNIQRRLNIVFFRTLVYYKIYLALFFWPFPCIHLHNLNNTDINGILSTQKFIVYKVLHYVRFFLLPEIKSCVTKSDVGAIILWRVFKILFAFYIVSFRIAEQKWLNQVIQIVRNGCTWNLGVFAPKFSLLPHHFSNNEAAHLHKTYENEHIKDKFADICPHLSNCRRTCIHHRRWRSKYGKDNAGKNNDCALKQNGTITIGKRLADILRPFSCESRKRSKISTAAPDDPF